MVLNVTLPSVVHFEKGCNFDLVGEEGEEEVVVAAALEATVEQ